MRWIKGSLVNLFVLGAMIVGCDGPSSTSETKSPLVGSNCSYSAVTLTGTPLNQNDPLTLDPRSVVIQNAFVKLSFPQSPNPDQKGAHRLDYYTYPAGWQQVTDPWYGDWTFPVSPLFATAVAAHVLTNTGNFVEVAFEFDHYLDYPGSYSCGDKPHWWTGTQSECDASSQCRCYLEGGGLVSLDFAGYTCFMQNSSTPKYIHHVTFTKNVAIERCRPGYYAGYHFSPSLTNSWIEANPASASAGEREFGMGWLGKTTFASSGTVIHNPEAGQHMSLNILEQGGTGPWWFATLPPSEANWPWLLFISEEHPLPSYVWQFAAGQYGIPLVHKMNDQIEYDGRTKRYQVFFGVQPYHVYNWTAEPTQQAKDTVTAFIPTAQDWADLP